MKIEIEIPDEDIQRLKDIEGLTEKFPDFEGYLKNLFEECGRVMLKKLYAGWIAIKSGILTPDEYVTQLIKEGIMIAKNADNREINNVN